MGAAQIKSQVYKQNAVLVSAQSLGVRVCVSPGTRIKCERETSGSAPGFF